MTTETTEQIYNRLITSQRPEKSTLSELDDVSLAAASDRSRVLFSAAFRRLQQKTQVFPLEGNSAVRSRLTHSLEVADFGRTIARKISDLREELLPREIKSAFVDIVETSCLMHDIGNPPFGHFGELAIQNWFKANGEKLYRESTGNSQLDLTSKYHLQDLIKFDGNPQGFRLISRLQYGLRPGMNLTFSQLLSGVKYPRAEGCRDNAGTSKIGYFLTEEALVAKAHTALGIERGRRHPLSYIMEAADDIAYCMSDLEDGFEKGLLNLDDITSTLGRLAEWNSGDFKCLLPKREQWGTTWDEQSRNFLRLKSGYARAMITAAARSYHSAHDQVLSGQLEEGLFPKGSDERKILQSLTTLARKHLFRHESVENLELAGSSVISGMLSHYEPLLRLPESKFALLISGKWPKAGLDAEVRLFGRLSKKHLCVYMQDSESLPSQEWWFRAHLIVDYVSGMTDQFALATFQRLSGHRIV